MTLEQDGQQINCEARIVFEWLPSPRISFSLTQRNEFNPTLSAIAFDDMPVLVYVSGNVSPASVIISNRSIDSGESGDWIRLSGFFKDAFVFDTGTDINHVLFHLVNFNQILGDAITDESRSWLGRAVVEFDGWKLTLDTLRGHTERQKL